MNAGKRLHVDISSIKGERYGGSKFWVLVVDGYTGYCWSYFIKGKSQSKDKILIFLNSHYLMTSGTWNNNLLTRCNGIVFFFKTLEGTEVFKNTNTKISLSINILVDLMPLPMTEAFI